MDDVEELKKKLADAQQAILEQQKLCDKHQADASARAQRAEAQAQKDREKCAALEREHVALRKEIGELKYDLQRWRSAMEAGFGKMVADGAVRQVMCELGARLRRAEERSENAFHIGRKIVFVRRFSESARNACILFDKEYRGDWDQKQWMEWYQSKKTERDRGGLSFDDLVKACKNIGFDLTCGACAGIFYTGVGVGAHTCGRKEEPILVNDEPDLDLLRKLANGEGGKRTGILKNLGYLAWTVTDKGLVALGLKDEPTCFDCGLSVSNCRKTYPYGCYFGG